MSVSSFFSDDGEGQQAKEVEGDKRKKVLVLAGCTGVGKTQISIEVALMCAERALELGYDGAEVISGDAMQFYKGMDIGTAKITPEEMRGIPHHLLDIVSPKSAQCNVSDFYDLAMSKIEEVHDRGALPIVVGGTTYYLKWLMLGKQKTPSLETELLTEIEDIVKKDNDWDISWERLRAVDPEYAETVPRNNYVRLCRALAVVTATGRTMREFDVHNTAGEDSFVHDFRPVFLVRDRGVMQRIVDLKVERMFATGFVNEVADCMRGGMTAKHHASKAVGYSELMEFLSMPTAEKPELKDVQRLIHAVQDKTRNVARKQLKFAMNAGMRHLWRWMNLDTLDNFKAPNVSPDGQLNTEALALPSTTAVTAAKEIVDLVALPREEFLATAETYPAPDVKRKNTKEQRSYLPKLVFFDEGNLLALQDHIRVQRQRLRERLQYRL